MCSDTILPTLLVLILQLTVSSMADPLSIACSTDASNYTLTSPFESNLKLLLQGLPANTSSTGFYNSSIAETPNKVYAQALCRGDTNSTTCQICVANATQEILQNCKSKDAIIWNELCQVRYSFQNFFGLPSYTGKYPDWNNREKNVSNPDRFNVALRYLLTNLSGEAAFDPAVMMFKTGEIRFSGKITIYGLVQCTRDVLKSDCHNCLNSAMEDLKACCYFKQGGMILSRNCNLRFEIYPFYSARGNLLAYETSKGNKWKIWMIMLVVSVPALVLAIIVGYGFVCIWRRKRKELNEEIARQEQLQEVVTPTGAIMAKQCDLVTSDELLFMDFTTIASATDNFSDSNKLGQGGFGTVYKGVLRNGKEIAVKRLSRKSWQGLDEFKNEIILIAKLQHRNLVRLIGCSFEGNEKLLIYEFMHNRSLDTFIFDSEKRIKLDWNAYYSIICGIARGLQYLHEDSRLKIVHRDLKPNNVLLDLEMTAKISDFGMARIFVENQTIANTRRIVGTYGYMAPEYAMAGMFSTKSDVFSFGVILLEIISGKKSSGFYLTEYSQSLLAYAWRLWNEGKELEFADQMIVERSSTEEVERCIQIGLLCVQEDPEERPTMSSVVFLLSGEPVSLPNPKQPAFSVGRIDKSDQSSNGLTLSSVSPR